MSDHGYPATLHLFSIALMSMGAALAERGLPDDIGLFDLNELKDILGRMELRLDGRDVPASGVSGPAPSPELRRALHDGIRDVFGATSLEEAVGADLVADLDAYLGTIEERAQRAPDPDVPVRGR